MKRFIVAAAFSFFLVSLFSQAPRTNEEKYWLYHSRFTKYFTVPGTSPGMSLVMNIICWYF